MPGTYTLVPRRYASPSSGPPGRTNAVTSAMWTQTRIRAVLARGGDGVVEVPGVVGVDREGRQGREVDAVVRGVGLARGVLSLGAGRARIVAVQAAVEHEALEHVARAVRAPEIADHPRAALARADEHEVAGTGAALLHGGPRSPPEERLGHEEAPALLEHSHERLVEPPGARRHRACSSRVSSAVGSASSRSVSGSSSARTCGLMPAVVIVFPPGR